jgi:hypothetical protein
MYNADGQRVSLQTVTTECLCRQSPLLSYRCPVPLAYSRHAIFLSMSTSALPPADFQSLQLETDGFRLFQIQAKLLA